MGNDYEWNNKGIFIAEASGITVESKALLNQVMFAGFLFLTTLVRSIYDI